MIVFVEYDTDGSLLHVVEIYATEGREVTPPEPGLTPEEKTEHQEAVQAATEANENDLRASIEEATSSTAQTLVLPEGAELPRIEDHIYDFDSQEIRPMTDEEKSAREETVQPEPAVEAAPEA